VVLVSDDRAESAVGADQSTDELQQLRTMGIVAGQKAVGVDQREPRGIYIDEGDYVLMKHSPGAVRCWLFGHKHETEPALHPANQEEVGTASYCPRCWKIHGYQTD